MARHLLGFRMSSGESGARCGNRAHCQRERLDGLAQYFDEKQPHLRPFSHGHGLHTVACVQCQTQDL